MQTQIELLKLKSLQTAALLHFAIWNTFQLINFSSSEMEGKGLRMHEMGILLRQTYTSNQQSTSTVREVINLYLSLLFNGYVKNRI